MSVITPPQHVIDKALEVAIWSPCAKSKRGVVVWDPVTGTIRGDGFNGPPEGFTCPGREACRGTCSLRCVHAEMRALEDATAYRATYTANFDRVGLFDLLHVELAPDGGVVPCDGPRCAQCSKHIVDAGFVGGVWLYVNTPPLMREAHPQATMWLRYSVKAFHKFSLVANGARP